MFLQDLSFLSMILIQWIVVDTLHYCFLSFIVYRNSILKI